MFKVIDLGPEGKPEESEDSERVAPPPSGTVRWIDCVRADPGSIDLLRRRFNFHPLALEDCATFEMRSKFEEYGDHLFIVLHTFTRAPDDPTYIQVHEVHAFVADAFLVTVHDNPVAATDGVWRKAAQDPTVLRRGPGWALYCVADAMIDATLPVIESLVQKVEAVEEQVLSGERRGMGPATRRGLNTLFSIRSTLVSMRRVMRPVRDVVAVLTRRAEAPLSERTALYFRDVQDHVLRCLETVDEAEHLIVNTIDAHRSDVATRTNAIMAKLTIFSAIFLPLGFIVGFWGQNFHSLPYDSERVLSWFSLGLCLVVPVVLIVWFWVKRWL